MKQQIPNDLFFAWVESELAEGRRVRFRLKGSSMFPLIREGRDEVMIRPLPFRQATYLRASIGSIEIIISAWPSRIKSD